jgi:hypothetical protein
MGAIVLRKLFLLLTTATLVLGVAGTAGAGALNWSGTNTLNLADFPPAVFTGGGVATVNGSTGAVPGHLSTLRLKNSRGQVSGSQTLFVTDPDTEGNNIASIQFLGLEGGTGTIAPISGGVASTANLTQNTLPVKGLVKLCLFSTSCTNFLPLVLTQPTTPTGTQIKGVGIGGLLTIGGANNIRISIQAAPWTVKTRTIIDQIETPSGGTSMQNIVVNGWAHGPASNTSSTASPSGVVQLVSPSQVFTNLTLGTNSALRADVVMNVHFVPEPGLLLLLGSGVVGLAVIGRKRLRK